MGLVELGLLVSLIGSIASVLIQLRKSKSETVNLDANSTSTMVETALKLNKQEFETLRVIYEDVFEKYSKQTIELEQAKKRIKELEDLLHNTHIEVTNIE